MTRGRLLKFGTLVATVLFRSTATAVAVASNQIPGRKPKMKIAHDTARNANGTELDMQTIRQRVASIKKQWTPEVARARAAEGARRRLELDSLVSSLLREMREDFEFECSEPSNRATRLTLVG